MWFWIVVVVVVLIVFSALGKADQQQKMAQIAGKGPEKLASLFKEEWPDFSKEITVGKCHSIIQRVLQDKNRLLPHYKSDGSKPKNERSRSFIIEYQVNTIAPMISLDFHEMAKKDPRDFHVRCERSFEIAIASTLS